MTPRNAQIDLCHLSPPSFTLSGPLTRIGLGWWDGEIDGGSNNEEKRNASFSLDQNKEWRKEKSAADRCGCKVIRFMRFLSPISSLFLLFLALIFVISMSSKKRCTP